MRHHQSDSKSDFFEMISSHVRDIKTYNSDVFEALLIPEVIECDYDNRSASFEVQVTDKMINFSGTLYGGVLSSLFDNATGILMRCYSGRYSSPTIELKVSFYRPAFIGDVVKIYTEIISITESFVDLFAIAYVSHIKAPLATASLRFFSKQ